MASQTESGRSGLGFAGQRVLIALFALCIGLPGLAHLSGIAQTSSNDERRELAELPRFPNSPERWAHFGPELEAYLADRFGFRPMLVAAASRMNFAFRMPFTHSVLQGKDHWFYSTGQSEIEQHAGIRLLSRAEIDQWISTLVFMNDWLAQHGIRFVFVIAPDKSEIYPEYLPDGIPAASRTVADQFTAALRLHGGIDFVDLRPVIRMAKSAGQLYYKRDSHWKPLAAYLGLKTVLSGRLPVGVVLPPLGAFAVDPTPFHGDLVDALRLGCCFSEPQDSLIPRSADSVTGYRRFEAMQGLASWIDTNHPDLPRIFILGDSFSWGWSNVVPAVASRVVHYENRSPLHASFVEQEKPALLIYEIVQRRLVEGPTSLVVP